MGINVALSYATTGELAIGSALKESAIGVLNPAKTLNSAGKLVVVLSKSKKATKAAGQAFQQAKEIR